MWYNGLKNVLQLLNTNATIEIPLFPEISENKPNEEVKNIIFQTFLLIKCKGEGTQEAVKQAQIIIWQNLFE